MEFSYYERCWNLSAEQGRKCIVPKALRAFIGGYFYRIKARADGSYQRWFLVILVMV